jgi:hypothetical protein
MQHVLLGLIALALAFPGTLYGDTPPTPLQLTASERADFQLGNQLGQAAFAYADLAHKAGQISRTDDGHHQIQQLAALAPLADQSRANALNGFQGALTLLVSLHAPAVAIKPVQAAVDRLHKSVALSGDAHVVSLFSGKAAKTLGVLDEFNALSSVPDDPGLQHWLTSPLSGRTAHVWYAEGLIGALAQIAATDQMPDLLPPVKEIATDLRGLQDWLSLRLPDTPTPDQAALGAAIDDFLKKASRTGLPPDAHVSATQLQALGEISRDLQALVSATAPVAHPLPSGGTRTSAPP